MKNGIKPKLLTVASGAHFTWILPAKVSTLVTVSVGRFPAIWTSTLRVSLNERLFIVHVEQW